MSLSDHISHSCRLKRRDFMQIRTLEWGADSLEMAYRQAALARLLLRAATGTSVVLAIENTISI